MTPSLRLAALLVAGLASCTRAPNPSAPATEGHAEAAPTNRVAIPPAVRKNLGITFASVESRAVARTMRVPGRFELLPTARREYRAPVGGRVELLVRQYDRVEAGTPLYRVDSPEWRRLLEEIAATRARVESMVPLRDAHRVHETSTAEKVEIWRARVAQLENLRDAGGGIAAQLAEAKATLNSTQADLADLLEKDAELEAQDRVLNADLRALEARRDLLLESTGAAGAASANSIEVRAVSPGVVESIDATTGGLVGDSGLVLSVVQPEAIRLRARGLQSDLGVLRDGLPVRIVPPQGGSVDLQDTMEGGLRLSPLADPDGRTIDLLVEPTALSAWARPGVTAHLEVTLDGGDEELAIPARAVVRDGTVPVIFRRDPSNPDEAIRMEADLGVSDGRWVAVLSGVKAGDEVVLDGTYQLMLATSGAASQGGHFHPDGTFHEGSH